MRTQDFVRAAAGVLVTVLAAGAYAQAKVDKKKKKKEAADDLGPPMD